MRRRFLRWLALLQIDYQLTYRQEWEAITEAVNKIRKDKAE